MSEKIRKPRHNPDKPQNNYGGDGDCPYDDGTMYKECGYPWAKKCDGNRYKCRKLYYQHLATLSDVERERFIERNGDMITTPRMKP